LGSAVYSRAGRIPHEVGHFDPEGTREAVDETELRLLLAILQKGQIWRWFSDHFAEFVEGEPPPLTVVPHPPTEHHRVNCCHNISYSIALAISFHNLILL
jgi:hypothetical protein